MTVSELDNLAAETAAYMCTEHPDYARLAARISISNLHKETAGSFIETMQTIHNHVDLATQRKSEFLDPAMLACWDTILVGWGAILASKGAILWPVRTP